MSVYTLASLNPQAQGQRPGGVATGHVPQQPNLGLGPNRYVPPTFNWGRGGLDGRQPQYTQMDWNQMQGFYMPQQQNNTFTNPYMQQLQGMLGMFSNQYGGPNRQPVMPQFGSYNPGFGGPTSFYDQMRGGTGGQGSGGFWGNYGPEDQEFGGSIMPVRGGGMYGREYDRRAAYEHARQQPDFDWENYGESMDGPRLPYGSNGGGFGGRGGYPQMPQFNPYMLARNNMRGMDFNEMFDPRFAMLFGMGGLGSLRPQGFAATQPQQPPSTANGQKPLAIGGGGDSSGMQRNPAGFLEPTAPYGSQDYWRSRYDQHYRDLESGGWSGNRIPYEQWQREVSQPVYAFGGGG